MFLPHGYYVKIDHRLNTGVYKICAQCDRDRAKRYWLKKRKKKGQLVFEDASGSWLDGREKRHAKREKQTRYYW